MVFGLGRRPGTMAIASEASRLGPPARPSSACASALRSASASSRRVGNEGVGQGKAGRHHGTRARRDAADEEEEEREMRSGSPRRIAWIFPVAVASGGRRSTWSQPPWRHWSAATRSAPEFAPSADRNASPTWSRSIAPTAGLIGRRRAGRLRAPAPGAGSRLARRRSGRAASPRARARRRCRERSRRRPSASARSGWCEGESSSRSPRTGNGTGIRRSPPDRRATHSGE